MRWIEFQITEFFENATKFLPLPGGEGRTEGERKFTLTFGRGFGIIVVIIIIKIIRQLFRQRIAPGA
jgi:hypothetical protein